MPKNILRAIKIGVSAGLIIYLVYAVNWVRTVTELRDTRLSLVILAAVIFVVNTTATSAWKWRISLRIHRLDWPVMRLAQIILIGSFMGNLLPTAIGGDIYRVYRTIPSEGRKSRALSALLLDRLLGLLSLFFVGAFGASLLYLHTHDPDVGFLALVFAAPALIALAVPYLFDLYFLKPLFKKLASVRKLEPLVNNARLIFADKTGLASLSVASVVFHVLAVTAITLLFAAADTHGVWAESAVADTMYSAIGLLPISINGLGVQEGSFAFTAHQLGIDFGHAVIVAMLLRIIALLTSLSGGIFFIFDKGRAGQSVGAVNTTEKSLD